MSTPKHVDLDGMSMDRIYESAQAFARLGIGENGKKVKVRAALKALTDCPVICTSKKAWATGAAWFQALAESGDD